MKTTIKLIMVIITVTAIAMLTGCSGRGGNSSVSGNTKVGMKVVFANSSTVTTANSLGATSVLLNIYPLNPAITLASSSANIDLTQYLSTGKVPDIALPDPVSPATSEPYLFRITAWNSSNKVIYCGQTLTRIAAGNNSIDLTALSLNGFDSVMGTYTISASDGTEVAIPITSSGTGSGTSSGGSFVTVYAAPNSSGNFDVVFRARSSSNTFTAHGKGSIDAGTGSGSGTGTDETTGSPVTWTCSRQASSSTPTTPSSDPLIYTNGNIYGVQSGPTKPTAFSINTSYKVTFMNTYHYFNGGILPGTISLKHSDGTVYGPWQATGLAGQGGVANATWIVQPNVVIKPGDYTVLDSDIATWSQNSQSSNAGFVEIRGIAEVPPSSPYLTAIAVTPANQSKAVGATQQYTATGTYSDNSTQNLTSSVTWSSSAPSIATIATSGIATAVASGSTTIIATMPVTTPIPGSVTGSTSLGVTAGGATTTYSSGVISSSDGINWTSNFSLNSLSAGDVSAGITFGGQFALAGYNNLTGVPFVLTSPDSISWTARTVPTSSLYGITYGDGQLVAFGGTGGAADTPYISTSSDGISWTGRTLPSLVAGTSGNLANGIYAGGQFVVVGGILQTGSPIFAPYILTSPDGITWTSRAVPTGVTSYLRGVAYGGGQFVALGGTSILTSTDGITWTSRTGPSAILTNVTYGGGQFVGVGVASNAPFIATSPDGITWTSRTLPTLPTGTVNLTNAATYGGGQFVVVGGITSGTTKSSYILTSSDGITWTSRSLPAGIINGALSSITYDGSKFVAILNNVVATN